MLIYFKRAVQTDSKQKKKFVRHYFSDVKLLEGPLKIATIDFWLDQDLLNGINPPSSMSYCYIFPNLCIGERIENSIFYKVESIQLHGVIDFPDIQAAMDFSNKCQYSRIIPNWKIKGFKKAENFPVISFQDFCRLTGRNPIELNRIQSSDTETDEIQWSNKKLDNYNTLVFKDVKNLESASVIEGVSKLGGKKSWIIYDDSKQNKLISQFWTLNYQLTAHEIKGNCRKDVNDIGFIGLHGSQIKFVSSKYSYCLLSERDLILDKIHIDHVTYYLGKIEYKNKNFKEAQYWFELTHKLFRNIDDKSLVVGYSLLFAAKSSLKLYDNESAKRNFLNRKFKSDYGIDFYNRAFIALDNSYLDFILHTETDLVWQKNKYDLEEYSYTVIDAKSDLLKSRRLIQNEIRNKNSSFWVYRKNSNEFRLVLCFLKTYFYEAVCDFIQAHYIIQDLTSKSQDKHEAALLLYKTANTMQSFVKVKSKRFGYRSYWWFEGVEKIRHLLKDNSLSRFVDPGTNIPTNLSKSISKNDAIFWKNWSLIKLKMLPKNISDKYLNDFKLNYPNQKSINKQILVDYDILRRSWDLCGEDENGGEVLFHAKKFSLLSTIYFQYYEAKVYLLNKNYNQCIITLNKHLKLISNQYSRPYIMNEISDWDSYYALDERAFCQIIEAFYLKAKCEFKLNNLVKSFIDLNEALVLRQYIRNQYSILIEKKLSRQINYLKKTLLKNIGYIPGDNDFFNCYYQMANSQYDSLKLEIYKSKNNVKLNVSNCKLSEFNLSDNNGFYHSNWLYEVEEIEFFLERHSEFGKSKRRAKAILKDCYDFSDKLREAVWKKRADWRDIQGVDEAREAYWNWNVRYL